MLEKSKENLDLVLVSTYAYCAQWIHRQDQPNIDYEAFCEKRSLLKLVNAFQPLTMFAKSSIIGV